MARYSSPKTALEAEAPKHQGLGAQAAPGYRLSFAHECPQFLAGFVACSGLANGRTVSTHLFGRHMAEALEPRAELLKSARPVAALGKLARIRLA